MEKRVSNGSKFKKGDKVICIDDSGSSFLIRNSVYTVTDLGYEHGPRTAPICGIQLEENGEFYLESRFSPAYPSEDAVDHTMHEPMQMLGTNPKDLVGIKKTRLSLVPPSSIIYQALAMEDGAVKYGPYNWRQNKVTASIYVDAAMRHLQQWFDGEDNATDSKKPHLAHAIACIGILIDAKETGNMLDDRPTKGPAAALLERFKK